MGIRDILLGKIIDLGLQNSYVIEKWLFFAKMSKH